MGVTYTPPGPELGAVILTLDRAERITLLGVLDDPRQSLAELRGELLSDPAGLGDGMTQIISADSGTCLCLGCDRMVSQAVGDGHVPYDPLANKSLVYIARDAVAFMSYTGSAYLESLPADEWIARALTGTFGDDLNAPWQDTGASTWSVTRAGPLPEWYEIGYAGAVLAQRLDPLLPSLLAANIEPTRILATGMKFSSTAPGVAWAPFGMWVTVEDESYRWAFNRSPLSIAEFPRSRFNQEEQDEFGQEVRAAGEDVRTLEDAVIGAIRRGAEKHPGLIGRDVMTMSIDTNRSNVIRIRFASDEVHTVPYGPTHPESIIPVMYSPWLIGPTLAKPPTQIAGPFPIQLQGNGIISPYTVEFVDPPGPLPHGLVAAEIEMHRRTYEG